MQLPNSLSHPDPFYHKEENGKSNNIKVFERNNTKILNMRFMTLVLPLL